LISYHHISSCSFSSLQDNERDDAGADDEDEEDDGAEDGDDSFSLSPVVPGSVNEVLGNACL